MMKVYYDEDADLSVLDGRTVAILGYGNQGRAQGMNMRDSGVEVVVGNIKDESFEMAVSDGFSTMSIAEASKAADILCILLPDEIQQAAFNNEIAPNLTPHKALDFAHGYSIRYNLISPPKDVDVIMVAPRMIGVGVRDRYLAGSGALAFVAVEQDATGTAWPLTLALAKAIGATRAGALVSTFAEETELDHFMEQLVWPTIFGLFMESYEFLRKNGYQEEAILLELYASGEACEIVRRMADVGLFRQTTFHSQTSQYGTLSRAPHALPEGFSIRMANALNAIRSGEFSGEWEAERLAGYPEFGRLKSEALAHHINEVEDRLHKLVRADSEV